MASSKLGRGMTLITSGPSLVSLDIGQRNGCENFAFFIIFFQSTFNLFMTVLQNPIFIYLFFRSTPAVGDQLGLSYMFMVCIQYTIHIFHIQNYCQLWMTPKGQLGSF